MEEKQTIMEAYEDEKEHESFKELENLYDQIENILKGNYEPKKGYDC